MNDEVERDEFSVYVFAHDGTYARRVSFVSAGFAVGCARALVLTAQRDGVVQVMITDGGDHTVFLWRQGEGVVFPPLTEG